ncbi:MAG: bifunctional RNase H/acid phosphatase [Actinomycetota bacterium]|nr:bifunctional RNase H/acid phosphatase [Actinomycetota bacterium]
MSAAGLSVVIEADGGSRGNPGPAGYGALVCDAGTGEVLTERSEYIGTETNNVAEYRGLIAGLTAAADLGARVVHVRMDSKLVVEQMTGRWQVKHPSMRPLAREASALRARFDTITFEWIPRELNKRADRLANEALDRQAGTAPRSRAGTARAVEPDRAIAPGPTWTLPAGRPTRMILVRHGATEHSRDKRFSGRNDLALSEDGRAQARALAGRTSSLGATAVVSSPLRRAQETAQSMAAEIGCAVETNEELAEVDFGRWEGLTFAEARHDYADEMAAWLASTEVAPPGGESFDAAARRVRRGRDGVIDAHPGETVIVVSHVTPIKTLIRFALDAPPVSLFRIHLDTASLSVVEYYPDGNSSLRLVNDTSHL